MWQPLERTDGITDLGELLDGRLDGVWAVAGFHEQQQEVAVVQQRFLGHHLAVLIDRLRDMKEDN